MWKNENTEPFGNSVPNENPSGLGVFENNNRGDGQYYDKETGLVHNGKRTLDTSLGRYIQSDPVGQRAGLNTYLHVGGNPLRWIDRFGLTAADVQGVWRDTLASFPELKPETLRICFRGMPDGINGQTSNWSGEICIDPSWANIPCLSRSQFENLFFTLFHEGMHGTDKWWERAMTSNDLSDPYHNTIAGRAEFERTRIPRQNAPSYSVWGKPRETAVDIDRLYEAYKKRTPACCE